MREVCEHLETILIFVLITPKKFHKLNILDYKHKLNIYTKTIEDSVYRIL